MSICTMRFPSSCVRDRPEVNGSRSACWIAQRWSSAEMQLLARPIKLACRIVRVYLCESERLGHCDDAVFAHNPYYSSQHFFLNNPSVAPIMVVVKLLDVALRPTRSSFLSRLPVSFINVLFRFLDPIEKLDYALVITKSYENFYCVLEYTLHLLRLNTFPTSSLWLM